MQFKDDELKRMRVEYNEWIRQADAEKDPEKKRRLEGNAEILMKKIDARTQELMEELNHTLKVSPERQEGESVPVHGQAPIPPPVIAEESALDRVKKELRDAGVDYRAAVVWNQGLYKELESERQQYKETMKILNEKIVESRKKKDAARERMLDLRQKKKELLEDKP